MRFVYPWFLLLLIGVPLLGMLWFWMARQGRRNLGRLVSPALQPRLMPPRSALRSDIQLGLLLAGFLLLALAAARPQWGSRDEHVASRSRNLVIALDVSRSMLARDVHPNRLERAKVDIMDLISELKGDRAALLAFRKRGMLICPLTTDYAFLRQALDGISIDSAPRGETDLADAIRKSLDALSPAQDDHNAILLISDGEDLAGGVLEAAQESRRRGVPIFTVGIGDTSGATVPDENGTGVLAYQGNQVSSHLTEETLSAIARESGGRYVPLGTASTVQTTLGAIFRQHLRQIAAREQQETIARKRVERYQWFLLPAIGCVLLAAFLSRGRLSGKRTTATGNANRTPPVLPLIVPVLLLTAGWVQGATTAVPPQPATSDTPTNAPAVGSATSREMARTAQSLFRHGAYRESADTYIAAAHRADTEESRTYLFNAAIALQQIPAREEAIDLLAPLIHDPRLGDRAAEILGLAAYQKAAATNGPDAAEAKLTATETAGAAFQQALRRQPADVRRAHNLTCIEQQLPSLREEARISRLLKQHAKTPPDQLISTMLKEQRALIHDTPAALTNEAPEQIRQLDALATRQDNACDLWIPLKQAVLHSPALTNAGQRALLERIVETTRDRMNETAACMRDLDPQACPMLIQTEEPVYRFWRDMAAPPALLDEDIALQSNVLEHAGSPLVPHRPDQPEALELTCAFDQRFPPWADQLVKAAQSDTNAPTLKPEDRAEIERLAHQTIALQQKPQQSQARQALQNLLRIRELLPKQKQQQQPQPQPQDQPQSKPEDKPQPQQPPPQPKDRQEQKEQPKPDQPEPPPKNVQDLLQRALQREREHDVQQRQQLQHQPMLPNERDW